MTYSFTIEFYSNYIKHTSHFKAEKEYEEAESLNKMEKIIFTNYQLNHLIYKHSYQVLMSAKFVKSFSDKIGREHFRQRAYAKPFPNKSETMPYSILPSDAYVGHSGSPGVDQGT